MIASRPYTRTRIYCILYTSSNKRVKTFRRLTAFITIIMDRRRRRNIYCHYVPDCIYIYIYIQGVSVGFIYIYIYTFNRSSIGRHSSVSIYTYTYYMGTPIFTPPSLTRVACTPLRQYFNYTVAIQFYATRNVQKTPQASYTAVYLAVNRFYSL